MPKADSDVNPPTGVRRLTVPASVDMVNVLGPRDEFLRILERDLAADVHVPDDASAAVEPLVTFAGELPADVAFELDGEGRARLVGGTSGANRTGWFAAPDDGVVHLQVNADPTGSSWVVSVPPRSGVAWKRQSRKR